MEIDVIQERKKFYALYWGQEIVLDRHDGRIYEVGEWVMSLINDWPDRFVLLLKEYQGKMDVSQVEQFRKRGYYAYWGVEGYGNEGELGFRLVNRRMVVVKKGQSVGRSEGNWILTDEETRSRKTVSLMEDHGIGKRRLGVCKDEYERKRWAEMGFDGFDDFKRVRGAVVFDDETILGRRVGIKCGIKPRESKFVSFVHGRMIDELSDMLKGEGYGEFEVKRGDVKEGWIGLRVSVFVW